MGKFQYFLVLGDFHFRPLIILNPDPAKPREEARSSEEKTR